MDVREIRLTESQVDEILAKGNVGTAMDRDDLVNGLFVDCNPDEPDITLGHVFDTLQNWYNLLCENDVDF